MKINLKEIIEQKALNQEELAKQLFPGINYPKLALKRILAGEGNLDEVQVSKLASILGCSIDELYKNRKWKASNSKGVHVFTSGDFKAELVKSESEDSWKTKIYKNDSLFHETILHGKTITLSEYLEEINNIIQKYIQDETR